MAKIYYDSDVKLDPLKDKIVAVVGYGNQGRAQALNLRDSGVKVVVGVRPNGKSWRAAESDGFTPKRIEDAVKEADVVQILVPDLQQPGVYEKHIAPFLDKGMALGFSHGFCIHYGLIKPPSHVDVFMVAPKSPGPRLREEYLAGRGVPSLVAVAQDYSGSAKELALAYAKAIGSTRSGVIETTFAEEVETDLFGEQSVLVGGITYLILAGYETLVNSGYQPEVAYFEVLNELKLIVDLIYRGGLSYMLRSVSETARYGGLTRGSWVIGEESRKAMRKLLEDIRNGSFAKEWAGDIKSSMKRLEELIKKVENHQIEKVGKTIRSMIGLGGD